MTSAYLNQLKSDYNNFAKSDPGDIFEFLESQVSNDPSDILTEIAGLLQYAAIKAKEANNTDLIPLIVNVAKSLQPALDECA